MTVVDTEQFLNSHTFVEDVREKLPRHASRTWPRRLLDDLAGMVWHQSLGTGNAHGTARYHVGPNHISSEGLPALSYTFYVEQDGTVLLCNDLEETTFSQGDRSRPGDENRRYVAVCFSGNFDAPGYRGSEYVSARQVSAGLQLWLACSRTFRWDGDRLFGHCHMGKAVCPGIALSHVIDIVRSDPVRRYGFTHDGLDTPKGRQQALQKLGFYMGALDGIWGVESRRALAGYQASRNLTVDGIWGPESYEALRRDV